MTIWESGYTDVQDVRLHYTRTGGRLPALVLVHGVGDDGLCWTRVAEQLAPSFDVLMVDARGHGRCEAPLQGYGPADLIGLCKALGLDQPIVLGHSMGAMTALTLAGTAPELPRAILLEDPPPWWALTAASAQGEPERRAAMRAGMGELKRKPRAELLAGQRAVAPSWPEAELERWADSKIRFSPNVLCRRPVMVCYSATCFGYCEPRNHTPRQCAGGALHPLRRAAAPRRRDAHQRRLRRGAVRPGPWRPTGGGRGHRGEA